MKDRREDQGPKVNPNRKKKSLWGILLCAGALFAVVGTGAFFFYQTVYRVEPVFNSVTYELGDRISRDLGDYLSGTEWSVRLGELDISQVDRGHTGTYQAIVSHGREEFVFEIIIEDTVPPDIETKGNTIYLAVGRDYRAEELIRGASDLSGQVTLGFLEPDGLSETVKFDRTGSFECVVTAEDLSGNRASVSIPVIVDTPPRITGVQDIYIALGSQVDFLELVAAYDDRDGNLTDRLTVEDSQVELTREGTYRLAYRVEDDFGLDSVSYADVTVTTAEELQKMIGSRQVDRNSDRIIGAINIYDAGVSSEDDIEETLGYMRPALVQLYHRSGSGYSAGSGYIMEITEDTVYICSNRHVVEAYDRWDIYFFDGTSVTGETLGISDNYDVGVATVAVEDLPQELLDQLMTVHIDKKYWNGLNDQRIDVGLERVDREGGILHVSTGSLLKIKQYFKWYDQREHTEVTLKLEHGDSGSAVMDGYGNLICMAFAYSNSPRRNWCIPLDAILECYEEITGRSVYTY